MGFWHISCFACVFLVFLHSFSGPHGPRGILSGLGACLSGLCGGGLSAWGLWGWAPRHLGLLWAPWALGAGGLARFCFLFVCGSLGSLGSKVSKGRPQAPRSPGRPPRAQRAQRRPQGAQRRPQGAQRRPSGPGSPPKQSSRQAPTTEPRVKGPKPTEGPKAPRGPEQAQKAQGP